jgi:protocatechuate 3,4-dioxygenase alpha subunit
VTPETTPSQTVGPYLHIGLPWPEGPCAVPPDAPGALRIHGFVLDGAGDPVPDALIETWQAAPDGGFAHAGDPAAGQTGGAGDGSPRSAQAGGDAGTDAAPSRVAPDPVPGFRGFARVPTDVDGGWTITTLKPGRVPSADGLQAPHLDVSVFARGLLHRVVTRIYFGDEEAANAEDPLLRAVDPARRATLLARPHPDGGYRHDIHLQGPDETVFFVL